VAAQSVVGNGIKLVGESFLTGASQMLEGQVVQGIASFAAGTLGAALIAKVSVPLALTALIAVKADSYSRSISSEGLLSRLGSAMRPNTETEPADSTAHEARAASRSR
jgi:hypothetical protein